MSAKELAKANGMRSLRFPRWLGVAVSHLTGLGEKLGLGNAIDPAWMKYSCRRASSPSSRPERPWTSSCAARR